MKVACYARVSTTQQAEKALSIPDQVEQLKTYCAAHGHQIIRIYREEGASARDENRPVFREMIAECLRKESGIEAILTLTTSRFFRDATKARIYKHNLAKRGIRVIATSQETSLDPTGSLLEGIFELIDQYESEMNGFHTLRAQKENARQGFGNGGIAPHGYHWKRSIVAGGAEKSSLEIVPEEAELIGRVFQDYSRGVGALQIAQALNRDGFRTRYGKPWEKNAILRMLGNPAYAGESYFNRYSSKSGQLKPESEWLKIPCPAVVSRALFEKVQKMRVARQPSQTNPAVTGSPTLLTGLVECGKCGASMTLETGRGGRYRYYNCRSRIRKGRSACEGNRVATAELEHAILDHLVNRVFSAPRLRLLLGEVNQAHSELRRRNNGQEQALRKRIQDVQERLDRYFDLIERGALGEQDVVERVRALKASKGELEVALDRQTRPVAKLEPNLFKAHHLAEMQGALRRAFLDTESELPKAYLRLLLEKAVVTGRRVSLVGKKSGIGTLALSGGRLEAATTATSVEPSISDRGAAPPTAVRLTGEAPTRRSPVVV